MIEAIFFGIIFLVLLGVVIAFIWAFIRSREFREDLLAHKSENEISIGPLSAKGVLFLCLLALFLGSTIYLFSQFLEHIKSDSYQESEDANASLVKENNELAKENITFKEKLVELEKELENYKLNLFKQSAIMDVYKNTRLLAYSSNSEIKSKPADNVLTVLSARLGTINELAQSKGVDLTKEFSSNCNRKVSCSMIKDYWGIGGNKPVELVLEYMCLGEYQLYRESINNSAQETVNIECQST